ncbi:MAG: DEAD/DEAH box helicase [Gemmatimonadetes bacterium]|nr:DEAD/DEAH box helicase [Gemmatimonadota bacterium]MYB97079.1 DEAD/DEAH box helicase [Gemmatimonadota bacterium]MYI45274.1 DEAD/DEAH box helicase [Gemmatimonadota bacterium]
MTRIPRPGMLATVRNRRGTVTSVAPFDGENGRVHLVHLEYQDGGSPTAERLLWELEPDRTLLEPTALPDPYDTDPMPAADFDALLRAARWTALSPYLGLDGQGRTERHGPIASPFHGGVRVEDFQIVPLLKALRMPRVSLLIADDVGLGKTVEAGLILTELLLRRRIRRVLVLTPAALRDQWKEELWEKFSLPFEVVDRKATEKLRRRLGIDANPWRSFSRIIASFHYLRQPDVQEQFLSACRTPDGSPHLPWDLLIVDECHNLMPASFGEDSQLCRMLGLIAPRFEHRLFLSATPHNGHTRSFTGLLEMLDPVRFARTSEMNPAMRKRVDDLVIRRLKRDINAGTAGPRFCSRKPPQALPLASNPLEAELTAAFDTFRSSVGGLIATGTQGRRRAGTFAVEVLGKRLLSCPAAFADSWHRTMRGMEEGTASDADVGVAERVLGQETGDDREAQQRQATAATVVGGWLRNYRDDLTPEIDRIQVAVEALGFDPAGPPPTQQVPAADARFDQLIALIERLLRRDGRFRDDERLIVFTEYKTTLDYLANRLRIRYPADRILTLFGVGGPGGMGATERESVKDAFNDPGARVRILVATDAASEGLNLHRTARYLLHYDCPWNPSRLEQRNGRLDRYGQARDVTVHHFDSTADPDIRFLDYVIRKADGIREDLGSANEIFDHAVRRRLIVGEDRGVVQNDLDLGVDNARAERMTGFDTTIATGNGKVGAGEAIRALADAIGLSAPVMAETLEAAMAVSGPRPQLDDAGEPDLYRIRHPELAEWKSVIDSSVRRPAASATGALEPVRKIAFGPAPFIERLGDLDVFKTRPDALLMHLAHPLMKRALGLLTRLRYPGEGAKSRWTVRIGGVPPGAEGLILLSVEELGVNELRESFHHWVRTVAFPLRNGRIGRPLPHTSFAALGGGRGTTNPADWDRARDLLVDADRDLKRWLREYQAGLTRGLRDQLGTDEAADRRREDQRYRQREGEVSALIEQSTVGRLNREIEALKVKRQQGQLFDEAGSLDKLDRSIEEKESEIERRRAHYDEIREQLRRERTRILDHLLPARFALSGEAGVFPVTIEVRLPPIAGPRGGKCTLHMT